ncbi:MAG: ABC transporter permease [Porphyromonadaceae bacterium]|nr:MAG: ABC transporter permease [Porphyromonadaceae bacterium]
MNKTLVIAKREYRAAVRTKGFLVTLLLLPVFMGGSLLVMALTKDKVDLTDKRIAVVDQSGIMGENLKKRAELRNELDLKDTVTGEKKYPAYFIDLVAPDTVDPNGQKLRLSDQVRNKETDAFIQIGPDIIHPVPGNEKSRIFYFSENSLMDETKNWIGSVLNEKIREIRVSELGIEQEKVGDLFYWINLEGMGLVKMDTRTGNIQDARKPNILETIMVPYILMFLMFMTLLMSAVPLLNAVMEEKSERIAEVLLGSVSPTQFMMGKVIGGLAVSLTTTGIYILGAILTINYLDVGEVIPYSVVPWFFVYLILNIIMVGCIMAALGSTCNDSKDAQAIQVTIPVWQPIAGLAGILIFTLISIWAGGRIFRSCIIMHGKRPKLGTLLRQMLKG